MINGRPSIFAVAVIAIVGLLSGCSSSATEATSSSSAGDDDRWAFGAADEATAALGSDAAPGEFPRAVTHAMGVTEIPERPQRVVVLDTGELDSVLSLGVKPVGMVTTGGAESVPTYLQDQVAGIETVGTIEELNLEAIAALRPDLILGSQNRAEDLYPQLAEIAPTVFSIRPGYPWKENFKLASEALGGEDEAIEVMNGYAESVDQLKNSVQGDPTVSLVRFSSDWIRLYGNKSLIGVILQDADLARPAAQQVDDLAVEVSPENISEAAGSVIFYTSYGTPDASGESSVVNSAGWKALSAVAEGKSYRVDDDVWFLGLGPTGAKIIVEQLQNYLVTT